MSRRLRRYLRFSLRLALRFLLYAVLLVCVLTTAGVSVLSRYLDPERLRVELREELSDFLQRSVTIDRISWQWYPRPILFGTDVCVTERDGRLLMRSPDIRVYPRLRDLLDRRLFIQGLGFHAPTIILRRYADGSTNLDKIVADILEHLGRKPAARTSAPSVVLKLIRLTGARIELVDERLKPGPLQAVLVTDGNFDFPAGDKPVTMSLRSSVRCVGARGSLAVTGSLGRRAILKATSQDFPVQALADYVPRLGGRTDRVALVATVELPHGRWALSGRSLPGRLFVQPPFSYEFKLRSEGPSSVKAAVALKRTHGEFSVTAPSFESLALALRGRFSDVDSEEVRTALAPWSSGAPVFAPPVQPSTGTAAWSLNAEISAAQASYQDLRCEALTARFQRAETGAWRIEAAAPRLSWRGESFTLSTATLVFAEGALTAEPTRFSGLGGRGTLGLALHPTPKGRELELDWDVADLDAARLLALWRAKPAITGRFSSKGGLLADPDAADDAGLRGAFSLALSSGVVSGLPGVVKFLSALNVRSLIRKVAGKSVEGLPFRVFSASCVVESGIVQTSAPAALRSDTMDIVLRGSIDLAHRTVQADVVVQFLTFFDEVVRLVPGVKQILIGKRKSMLPVWVRLTGPLGDPEVKVQPLKSLSKDLWHAVKGIFTLPEDLFKSVVRPAR